MWLKARVYVQINMKTNLNQQFFFFIQDKIYTLAWSNDLFGWKGKEGEWRGVE